MKTVRANTFIEIAVRCPYCGANDNKTEELRSHLVDEPRASDVNETVTCSECEKQFIVTDIDF